MIKLFKQSQLGVWKVFFLIIFLALQTIGTLYLPRLTANIINNGVVMQDRDYVFSTGALMLGVAILTGVAAILGTYFSAWVSTLFARNTRRQLFAQTQQLSYQDFRHFSTSSLITRATNDLEQLQGTLSMVFQMLLPAPFVVVIAFVLALRINTQMGLIFLIATVTISVIFALMAKWILPIFTEVQKGLDKVNEKVAQFITGIRVVRAFNRTKLERDRMDTSFGHFAKLNIKINRTFAMLMPFVMLLMSAVNIAIVWFGGIRIDSGDMLIGDITALLEYGMNMLMFLVMAVFTIVNIPRAKVCAARIREVLDYKPEIADGKFRLVEEDRPRLTFEDVDFRYLDAENAVLHGLSFTCKAGTTTAIIGGTGSGKSTIARLVPRLLDVSKGSIRLNGTNIKDVPQEELRKKIGFVPQRAFLFSGTIADNLRHGNPDATMGDMHEAVRISQSEDFIEALDEKYDANVSQGGKNFSGGQRQRLAIARMLMKKPDVYIFDDSFSALDFKTDAALRAALKDTTKDSIVITVAQRITTIMDADQILVVDEGKIVGRGTHHELLADCEVYQEIAKSQLSEEELGGVGA